MSKHINREKVIRFIVSVTSDIVIWFFSAFAITLFWKLSFSSLYHLPFSQALWGLAILDFASGYARARNKKS